MRSQRDLVSHTFRQTLSDPRGVKAEVATQWLTVAVIPLMVYMEMLMWKIQVGQCIELYCVAWPLNPGWSRGCIERVEQRLKCVRAIRRQQQHNVRILPGG